MVTNMTQNLLVAVLKKQICERQKKQKGLSDAFLLAAGFVLENGQWVHN